MTIENLVQLSAREAVARISDGSLSCEALACAYLDRIRDREPDVKAWQFLDADYVITQAKKLDRSSSRGPLHGVPLAVKDVIDTVDMPTTYGSAIYQGNRPPYDAACVAQARKAGALIFGKTVSTEFAFSAPGKTTNPYNKGHTPGGSSSGSAAAVGCQMVPLAFGTQTAGSVIRPSSFCGIVGYKPTFGLIDRTGVKTLATSFDTVGIMARNVLDVAFLTSIISGRSLKVSVPKTAPRIGIYLASSWHSADAAVVAAIDNIKRILIKRGAEVKDIAGPQWASELPDLHQAVMDWDVVQALSYERLYREEELAEKTRANLRERSTRTTPEKYDSAQAKIREVRSCLPDLFGDCDVLLTPAAPGEAPADLQTTGDAIFNRPWTMLQVPCVTVPVATGPNGLPIGLQIVGRIGDDEKTLSAGAYLESLMTY